jgi:small subunit ribosomal protein S8
MTDPVADFLTRIRNAVRVRRAAVEAPLSKMRVAIAEVLKREGFIRGFGVSAEGVQGLIRVDLKYGPEGEDVINRIRRVSCPGRRVYCAADEMTPLVGGMGIRIVSTSKGVLSDRECRRQRLGGEVLCEVW